MVIKMGSLTETETARLYDIWMDCERNGDSQEESASKIVNRFLRRSESMSKEREDYIIRNIITTMGVEKRKLTSENIELIRKYLRKEITMEQAIQMIDKIVLEGVK